MTRPKTLYRFCINHRLEKHVIGESCAPQLVERKPEGVLWRCRCTGDFYGFGMQKEARLEEVANLKQEITENYHLLRKLGYRVGLRWVWPDGRESKV